MSRNHPECPASESSDLWIAPEVLLRKEPDEEEDEEEEDENGSHPDDDEENDDGEGYSV